MFKPCLAALAVLGCCCVPIADSRAQQPARESTPLVIGETFTIESKVLGETRRINVYPPPGYGAEGRREVPVLYMPDGGLAEDFPARCRVGAGLGGQRHHAPVPAGRDREHAAPP